MTGEEIEQKLRDALTHLYDPDYEPDGALYDLTGCDPQGGALSVQSAVVQAIEDMKPPPDTPAGSLSLQLHALLHNRFVLKLTLEETAGRLHMSYSSAWRAQRAAVHALARLLWDRQHAGKQPSEIEETGDAIPLPEENAWNTQAQDWHSQMERELASLHASAPNTVSDVAETIGDVARLINALSSGHRTRLEVKYIQPGLMAAVHPSLLRQALITATRRMAQYAPTGQIAVYAGYEGGNVRITLTGAIADAGSAFNAEDLVGDLVVSESMSVEVCLDGSHIFLWIEAPSTGQVSVMVVDDNPDMVRFYRRATLGTRYHIIEAPQGEDALETIERTRPDIVVLDVMLPDVDGWQLLMHLHENPATRPIPVIVCTVIQEEELALSLGAALYLSKPLRRSTFIQALDQVLPPV